MITPSQIRQKKISTVEGGGYDRNEVNELLLEVIESYEAVYAENKELYRKMEILANRIEEYRADEDTIKNAFITAQKTADKLMNETKQKAAESLEESAKTAQKTVVDAKEKADKIISSARDYVANLTNEKEKAAGEIVDEAEKKANEALSGAKIVAQDVLEKAKTLSQELISKAKAEKEAQKELVEKLNAQSKTFKENLISLYEQQLEVVKNMAENTDISNISVDEEIENELNHIYASIDKRLCQAAKQKKNERLNLIIQTICATGIRVSELQYITVESAKCGEAIVNCKAKTRSVFIVKELKQKLLRYAEEQGIKSGMIFVTKSGKPINRTNIWREMKALCKDANVNPQKVFPHNLRHLFARTFYGIEKDIAKLADILGHSSINTTRIYIISTGTEHRKKMENMHLII